MDTERERRLVRLLETALRRIRLVNRIGVMAATSVLALPIGEASAKVRTGPPVDDAEDLAAPVWAGVIPLSLQCGAPVPDAHVASDVTPFDVSRLARRQQL